MSVTTPATPRRRSRLERRARTAAGIVLSLLATFLGLLFVTFIISRVVPIDPVLAIVGERASEAQIAATRTELGLDRSLWTQFWIYISHALQGDLGNSLLTRRPVIEDIGRVFPATLELATIATIFGILAGVPAGVLAATRPGSWLDQVVRIVGLAGYSMPVFWLGLMGLLLFYGNLGWVGGPGRLDALYEMMFEIDVPRVTGTILIDTALAGQWEMFRNALSHIVLPAGVLGYYSMAYISRMTRSFMLEQLSAEYITTARVKGLSERRVIWGHAFRNIAVPLVTVIALSFGSLLEGSVLTEIIFSWPGLGQYITKTLLAGDMNAVLGGTIVVGACFIGLNLLSDLLYRVLDPRAG